MEENKSKTEKEIIELWEKNQKIKDEEIDWILEMTKKLKESRKYVAKVHENKYYIKSYLSIYDNILIFFDLRLKKLRNRFR